MAKEMRFFNTAGPSSPEMHYHVPPLSRIDFDDVLLLIGQWKYFVLHAPRQRGKTSALLALRDQLNADGEFRCVYVNVEVGQAARENVREGVRAILSALARATRQTLDDEFVGKIWRVTLDEVGPNDALGEIRSLCAEADAKPVIECKVLHRCLDDTLRTGLVQTRAYMDRCAATEAHLVIFDRREDRSWEEKLYRRDEAEGGIPVTVWGT